VICLRAAPTCLREAEGWSPQGQRAPDHLAGYLGLWRRPQIPASRWKDPRGRIRDCAQKFLDLAARVGGRRLGALHYVYPYRMSDEVIALMADGKVLPIFDIRSSMRLRTCSSA